MKKNYAYTIPENQTCFTSLRLCRIFALSLLCLLLYPVAGLQANMRANSNAVADQLSVIIENYRSPGYISCDNKEVTLIAVSYLNGNVTKEGISYNWAGPDGFTSTADKVVATEAGEYQVTIRNAAGLSASTKYMVRGIDGAAGEDKVLRRTDSFIELEASTWGLFISPSWTASDGGNIVYGADTFTPLVNAPGTYTLTLTSQTTGCTMQDQVVVTSENVPLEDFEARIDKLTPKVLKCTHPTTSLSGYAWVNSNQVYRGLDYEWYGPDGFISNEMSITVSLAGDYILTLTDQISGTSDSDTVTVSGPNYPTGSAGPDKKLTCKNSTVTLEGSGSQQVVWFASDGGNIVSGAQTLSPVVDAPGTYTMVITGISSGCKFEDVVMVTREEELTVSATGGKLDCTTSSVQLTASSDKEGLTYSWTGPNGYTSTEQNPIVSVAGDYTVTVANPETGCTATRTVVVTPESTELLVERCLIDFNEEKKGLISTINTELGPVAVVGRKRNEGYPISFAPENHAAIFDSQAPTGDDADLYTRDWGNVLIVNKDLSDVPDDNQWGGELILDFSAIGPVTMESVKVLDIDAYEDESWVYLYDGEDKKINSFKLKALGNNSQQTQSLGNTMGVMKMKVVFDGKRDPSRLSGSGAIDDIRFYKQEVVASPCQNVLQQEALQAIAYPTTFSDKATVQFTLQDTGDYSVNLYDTQGNLVKELRTGTAMANEQIRIEVEAGNLKEGMYLARIVSPAGSKTLKLILKR
ncbi:T9SS type A sorting domain-containing protein [Pontibacter litorisediminis]|uniref:T9SS type A sorting domain-containing protein n=1 Tax=Pontibacter litorisediminis TaxID=1846260 RepID=UPI0023EAF39A|nr:T9SS type A sorting domain-containing protein [Pontibacter litorisediminis]